MSEKVRYYDIASGLKKWMDDDLELKELVEKEDLEIIDSFFVVPCPKGVVVSYEHEGIHQAKKTIKDTVKVDLWKKPKKNQWIAVPHYQLHVPIEDMMSDCSYTEHDIKDMVRTHGARLDTNYRLLLNSLEENGLDLSKYNTKRGE